MNLPVEYIHITFTARGAPSALGVWLALFNGLEPTHFATDEDGDTNARGPRGDHWVDLHRVDDDLHLYATPHERKTAYDRADRFDNARWVEVMVELAELAKRAASALVVDRVAVHVASSQRFEKRVPALDRYRSLAPALASLPDKAMDGRYQFSVPEKSRLVEGHGYMRSVSYRLGARAVEDPEGDYEGANGVAVRLLPHVGQEVTITSRRPDENPLSAELIAVLLDELVEVAHHVWSDGVETFS